MPKKTGAGGKPQDYNPDGTYGTGKKGSSENSGERTKRSASLKQIGEALNFYAKKDNSFKKATPEKFHKTLSETKKLIELDRRWRVDLHELEDYKNDKLFITPGGSCIAVEPSGNIISVCQRPGDGVRGYQLLEKAIQEGGDRLDAFGPDLFKFYTNNGFEPVSWTPFNEQYAPDEWKEAKRQGLKVEKEPVVFYKYTDRYNRSNNPYDYNEFLRTVKSDRDYDTAQNRRDKEIE